MPKKKRNYGAYTTERDGVMYAVVRLPKGDGTYKKKLKLLDSIGGTKIAAQSWAHSELEKWKHGEIPSDSDWTFSKLARWYAKEFLVPPVYQDGKRLYGLRTYADQIAVLERITTHFGRFKLTSISLDVLRRYKQERLKTVSISSVNREFALIRTMLKKAKARKWLTDSPFDAGETLIEVSLETSRKSPLTARIAKRLLARSRKSEQPLLYYVILVLMHTGARPSEIFPFHGERPDVPIEPLTWQNIIQYDFKAVLLVSYKGRIRKEKLVPTTVELEKGLRELYAVTIHQPSDYVFPLTSFKRSWATLCKSCKYEGVWMRDFRHYYNSRILQIPNINDVERMLLLGQTQLPTNLRYSHLDEGFIAKYRDALSR